jgi:hypothetical protein
MKVHAKKILVVVCGFAAAILIVGAMSLSITQKASALPAYAQSTGKPCGYCHVNPAGGGPRTAAGKKFQENGHKL